MSKCKMCGEVKPPNAERCPACGQWESGRIRPAESPVDEEEVVALSDARAGQVKRLPTFSPQLDTFFGGGVVATSTTLLGGPPGAGKTTFMLQLTDHLLKGDSRNALYIANEQNLAEIRETGLRLGLANMARIMGVRAMGGLRSNLWDLIERWNPCVLIVDSLPKLVNNDPLMAISVLRELKSVSAERCAPHRQSGQ